MPRFPTLIAVLLAATAVQAQDQGQPDSIFFVISEPTVGAVDQLVTAELYFFHDVQNIANMSFAFGWDNPNLQVDSIDRSPAATSAFNLMKLWLYRGSIDSCNANQFSSVLVCACPATGWQLRARRNW